MFRTTMMGLALAIGLGTLGCSTHQGMRVDMPEPAPAVVHETKPVDDATPSIVRSDDPAVVRAMLLNHRERQIARLEAYAAAGVFPKNVEAPMLLNVMRDREGHLCAVANLIHLDGHDDVVDAAVKENNYMKIAEQKTGAVHGWVLESGLTAEEISMIQAPYMPAREDVDSQKLERERLQAHFKSVIKLLTDDTDKSLALAVARMTGHKDSTVASTSQFATPPGV